MAGAVTGLVLYPPPDVDHTNHMWLCMPVIQTMGGKRKSKEGKLSTKNYLVSKSQRVFWRIKSRAAMPLTTDLGHLLEVQSTLGWILLSCFP